jgi:hypothetical protein
MPATLQLIKSGERERLKQLLREKLTECGWRDEVKQRCRGEAVHDAITKSIQLCDQLQLLVVCTVQTVLGLGVGTRSSSAAMVRPCMMQFKTGI